jgi:cysteine desulfurase
MIYLDNAATTKLDEEALRRMMPYLCEQFGNASAIYSLGKKSASAIRDARAEIAGVLGARPEEIFFTSGGSESDNWALRSVCVGRKKTHILISGIEHPAIYRTCQDLERENLAEVTIIPPDPDGLIDPDRVRSAIRPETVLVSVMYANNEIGTIQNIREIGRIAHEYGALMHTDAVQAFGHIPIRVDRDPIDLLSASGHKFNGPKGIGFLYIRRGLEIEPLIDGGGQESGRRSGTENVAGIVGMAEAASKAARLMSRRMEEEAGLRDRLLEELRQRIPDLQVNGSMKNRLPNNLNVTFPGVDAEELLLLLDRKEIFASAGSACSAGSLEPSRVLLAIGCSRRRAQESVRFSVSYDNTIEEIDEAAGEICRAVERLRNNA